MPVPEPYRRLQEIAPRLGKAWKDEQAYQARLAFERQRGLLSFSIVQEEMIRTIRRMTRNTNTGADAIYKMAEAFRALGRRDP